MGRTNLVLYIYIYIWKCLKETPCRAILNFKKYHFFSFTKSENRRAEQVLHGEVGTSGRGKEVG
jgi:hypothetical protein